MPVTEVRGPDLVFPSRGPTGPAGVNGVLSNVTLAKSASYTVANADKGKSLDLSGALYTVTLDAPAGYDADFVVFLYNASATRFKRIAISGIATDHWLPPLHHAIVRKSNSLWTIMRNARWRTPLAATLNLYCNNSSGSDTNNDGMDAASPFRTLSKAMQFVVTELDPSSAGSSATRVQINMAAGVVSDPGLDSFGPHAFVGGYGGQYARVIFGAGAGLTKTGSGSCIELDHGVILQIQGGVFSNAGTGALFDVDYGARLFMGGGAQLGACSGAHIGAANRGSVELFGPIEIVGSPGTYHVSCTRGGQYRQNGQTTTVSANMTVTDWAFAEKHGLVDYSASGSAITLSGGATVTGRKGNATMLGIIDALGATPDTFFPGTVAGTSSNGGLYL